ncbi:MAG TPA: PilZ domain-containing protein [Candidatus Eisenbacteria bacterium]|nr:PilZ domain-containing protein [Candidatus Eisenbacteria bacterium]
MAKDSAIGFQNRREFFRIKFSTPLKFKSYTGKAEQRSALSLTNGTSQNVSQSGILFRTVEAPPELSSILWMDVDLRTLKICQEIEDRALVFKNGLLGRVVRVEEESGLSQGGPSYDVGVCFLTQEQKNNKEVQEVLTAISKAA